MSCDHVHLASSHQHTASEGDFCLVRSIYAVPVDRSGQQNVRAVQQLDRSLFLAITDFIVAYYTEKDESDQVTDRPNLYAYLGIRSYGLRAPPMV